MATADVIALCALVVSLVALAVSTYNLRVADRAARNDMIAQLRGWGDAVVDLISDARALCGPQMSQLDVATFGLRQADLSSRASSLWDRGRFFFAKIDAGNFGADKPSAYRGFRPPILDLLALTFGIIERINPTPGTGDPDRWQALLELQRSFVSTVQAAMGKCAPQSLNRYEEFLARVGKDGVEPLPVKIRQLAGAEQQAFQVRFV